MKTSIEKIRHSACGELLVYRSKYRIFREIHYKNKSDYDRMLHEMYICFMRIELIYRMGLITTTEFDRAYHMYETLFLKKKDVIKCQSATN